MDKEEWKRLDDEYQKRLGEMKAGDPMPPCPACEAEMIYDDYFLFTGGHCSKCDWSFVEGTGCLV